MNVNSDANYEYLMQYLKDKFGAQATSTEAVVIETLCRIAHYNPMEVPPGKDHEVLVRIRIENIDEVDYMDTLAVYEPVEDKWFETHNGEELDLIESEAQGWREPMSNAQVRNLP